MKQVSLFIGALICWINSGNGQTCSNTETGTLSNTNSYSSSSGTNEVVIQWSEPSCGCAYVNAWLVHTSSQPATVYFQVWRPTAGQTYQLIGQNVHTVTTTPETYTVAVEDRIFTQTSDRLGIYVQGTQVVLQKGGSTVCLKDNMASLSVGNTLDFTGQCSVNREHAFLAYLTSAGSPPSFDNLDSTATVYDTSTAGQYVFTLSASDADNETLNYTMTSSSTSFQFDENTRRITVASTPPSGTETLHFKVEDSCATSDTGSLTITIVNSPLVITNLPNYTSLSEETTSKTLLQEIQITDLSPSDSHACVLGTVTPNSGSSNFLVEIVPGSTNYGIFSKASPSFSYQTVKTYKIEVDCNDGNNTATSFLRLYITENKPPVCHNLQNKTTVSRLSATANYIIFQTLATDEDSATINYALSCASTCPFDINSQGEVYVTTNLQASTTIGYDLLITIDDGVNTVGPNILTVLIEDINTPPVITNLNLTYPISLEENMGSGTVLYTVSSQDPDDSQTVSYSFSVDPVAGTSLFTVNTNGIISLLTATDYEVLNPNLTFNLTVTANDGQDTDTEYIAFTIINKNEAPSFALSIYNAVGTEGVAGDVVGTPAFVTNDPDGDNLTFSISCPEFTMNDTTGQVSLAVDYDLDIAGVASTIQCITTVSDGELSGTATLSITLNQVNDNTPQFGLDLYVFSTSVYSNIGDIVGNIAATDSDIGFYGTLVYSLDQSSLSYPMFEVLTNGDVKIALDLASYIGSGTSVSLKGNVTDYGGYFDTCDIIIVIQATTTTASTTTTERYKTFLEDTYNAAWLVGLLLAMTAGAFLVIGMLYHYDMCNTQTLILCCKGDKK